MGFEFKKKVLLVHNDLSVLDQLNKAHEHENDSNRINVTTVRSASKALKILKNEDFDAIVSGYQISEMDGIQFLKEVRREDCIGIPFILLTKKKNQNIVLKVLKRGGNRVLHWDEDVLLSGKVLAEALRLEIQHYEKEKELEHYRNEYREHYRIFER